MKSLFKFILSARFKDTGINKKISGFTLIELLVAMILAVLVIGPLMAFMINIMDSDSQEQAKANTEQEVQAALDYIARDLQQAVYIYDRDGLTRDRNTTTPANSGIRNQIPPVKTAPSCDSADTCQPILVFWKREIIEDSIRVTSSSSDTRTDDGYAYSLVAYYFIRNSGSPWSPAGRIGRFQIRGAVTTDNTRRLSKGDASYSDFTPPPINDTNIQAEGLKARMNQWQGTSAASYTIPVNTLVDYVRTTNDNIAASDPQPTCPNPGGGITFQAIGSTKRGFYTCVDANNNAAQVFLQGTAWARYKNQNNITDGSSQPSYFPSGSIRVQGQGFLFAK